VVDRDEANPIGDRRPDWLREMPSSISPCPTPTAPPPRPFPPDRSPPTPPPFPTQPRRSAPSCALPPHRAAAADAGSAPRTFPIGRQRRRPAASRAFLAHKNGVRSSLFLCSPSPLTSLPPPLAVYLCWSRSLPHRRRSLLGPRMLYTSALSPVSLLLGKPFPPSKSHWIDPILYLC
jgi:hypothetical protein